MRRLRQGLWIAWVGRAKGPGRQQDLHLRRPGAQLVDHLSDTLDIPLADAADENQIRPARDDIGGDAVQFLEMLATASAAHIHRGFNPGLGIGLRQPGHPTGTYGVVDDAVAQRQQAQFAPFGEDLAGPSERPPVGRRRREMAFGHGGLNLGNLGQRTARRTEDVIVLLGRFVSDVDMAGTLPAGLPPWGR